MFYDVHVVQYTLGISLEKSIIAKIVVNSLVKAVINRKVKIPIVRKKSFWKI